MKLGDASRVPVPRQVREILPEHLPDGMLSIAVFGPGEGEAIVVRLPDGSVGVVDGCREPQGGAADGHGDPVRELLAKLASNTLDPGRFRLEFVCLTHPHADHYRGLGRLLEAYEDRIGGVWTVTHLTPQYREALPEWLDIIRAGDAPDREVLSGLKRVLDRFDAAKALSSDGLSLLSQGKSLLYRQIAGKDLTITACGPADGDIDEAGKELIEILTVAAASGRVSGKHDPNLTSGALLLRWGKSAVLLAGDLLRGGGPQSGWQRARHHVGCEVQVVNVAHHASEGAHDDALWAAMNPALAIVTPFKYGAGDNPPRPERISALARTSVVAITSPPEWEGERNPPVGMRSINRRSFKPKNTVLPRIAPSGTADARRNAVAVSLDASGNITGVVLAGKADVYIAPDELGAGATAMKATAPSKRRP